MVEHPVLLRGAGTAARFREPLILQRTDEEIIPALLEELGDANGLASVLASRAHPPAGRSTLALYQPVHRIFHLALLEVVCDTVGYPRLDPEKIESAGLVLRRRATDDWGNLRPDLLEGWMQEAPTPRSRLAGAPARRGVRGWVQYGGRVGIPGTDLDRDPDPQRRPAELRSGHPELDRHLALTQPAAALEERVVPLFVAPPEVCRATGKTLLYGLIPVTSSEMSDAPEPLPAYDTADLAGHLPQLLKAGKAPSLPRPGRFVRATDVARPDLATAEPELEKFVGQLRQIAVEFDAFGTSAASRALRAEMERIELVFLDHARWPDHQLTEALAHYQGSRIFGGHYEPQGIVRRSAAAFLADAVRVLLSGDVPSGAVRMPIHWATLDAKQAARILAAVQGALSTRLRSMLPKSGRYGDARRQYRLRAFVRVREREGCPPRLVWSDYSEPFTIAPWFAPSDTPPAVIPLPDVLDRDALKALKPNVAFAVPKKLADFLNGNDPKKLARGEGDQGAGGIALDWICSFSLPIITLCAFIVLNIFLSLFDLIFRWLLFIKICLPIPRKK